MAVLGIRIRELGQQDQILWQQHFEIKDGARPLVYSIHEEDSQPKARLRIDPCSQPGQRGVEDGVLGFLSMASINSIISVILEALHTEILVVPSTECPTPLLGQHLQPSMPNRGITIQLRHMDTIFLGARKLVILLNQINDEQRQKVGVGHSLPCIPIAESTGNFGVCSKGPNSLTNLLIIEAEQDLRGLSICDHREPQAIVDSLHFPRSLTTLPSSKSIPLAHKRKVCSDSQDEDVNTGSMTRDLPSAKIPRLDKALEEASSNGNKDHASVPETNKAPFTHEQKRVETGKKGKSRIDTENQLTKTTHPQTALSTQVERRQTFILLCDVQIAKPLENFLASKNVGISAALNDQISILCVPQGWLPLDPRVAWGVSIGKQIVTTKWIVDSANAGELLECTDYLPIVPTLERAWSFRLVSVMERVQSYGNETFANWAVFGTEDFWEEEQKSIRYYRACLKASGCSHFKIFRGEQLFRLGKPRQLVLGVQNDKHRAAILGHGYQLYEKLIIPVSILRGYIDPNSRDFIIRTLPNKCDVIRG